ncbi:hotdog domain-containing protein [Gammaproteobacteria bacterium AB-CW1]|uniref:Hotdog domain-containing protein n=1 Tax=Natronospira elongata TaxID=3110268 RepID=A0AAP6JEJ1_9GAMM|nr:hotdog domain-containing protein [Gammaproteobacteria bacterium AB-CW1]
MRLLRFIARFPFLSETRKLELYPPFFMMRIKVVEMREQWRFCRIRLPLNTLSRNPGGTMFGGWQAALADPIAALACSRVFPGYSVWTRSMHIDFHTAGSSNLELRFEMSPEQEDAIRAQLARQGRATPEFRYGFFREDGRCCSVIRNAVAIRPKGYCRVDHQAVDLTDL